MKIQPKLRPPVIPDDPSEGTDEASDTTDTSKIAEIVEIDDELRKIEEFIEPNEDGEYHFEDLFLGTWDEDKDSAIKISLKETFGKHLFCLTVPSTTTLDELKQSITEHFHLVRQLGLLIASNSSLAARL